MSNYYTMDSDNFDNWHIDDLNKYDDLVITPKTTYSEALTLDVTFSNFEYCMNKLQFNPKKSTRKIFLECLKDIDKQLYKDIKALVNDKTYKKKFIDIVRDRGNHSKMLMAFSLFMNQLHYKYYTYAKTKYIKISYDLTKQLFFMISLAVYYPQFEKNKEVFFDDEYTFFKHNVELRKLFFDNIDASSLDIQKNTLILLEGLEKFFDRMRQFL